MVQFSRTPSTHSFFQVFRVTMLVCFFAQILLPQILPAQTIPISPKAIRDSRGKDFWMAFPRNHHTPGTIYDRLYITIVSERPTQGNINYVNNMGVRKNTPFSLPANEVYTLDVAYTELELFAPTISRTAIHITSTEEVTVYGLSVASTTSDAFLAFPTDVLGREYVIASYQSNVVSQGANVNLGTTTMSQFSIVAPYDSTLVDITPTVKTWNGDSTTYTVRLNRGDAYLVSLTPTLANPFADLTGSRIVASKPVVVYGGHERALIPAGQRSSRDYLVEQMLPVEVWGRRALIAPFALPGGNGNPDYGCDLVRVIAGYDNTIVQVNGATRATLQSGKFLELTISTSAVIECSEPVIVATYKCSTSNPNTVLGDPFLAIVPPVEQFLTRYRFACVQGTQLANNNGNTNRTEPAFQQHFVSIVVPSTRANTVLLDNRTIPPLLFRPIANSDYSYASVPISEGVHNMTADTAFGITLAGYGRANSYGYIGGQRFETDIRPPQIVVNRTCTGIAGRVFDSAFTDSKIFFYDTLRTTQRNIRFRFGNLPNPADSLGFQAELNNPYEDGELGLIAVDSLDLRTVQRITVPGYTVHNDPRIRTNAVVSTSSVIRLATKRDYCFRLPIRNYGATNQTIQSVGFTRSSPQFFSTQFASGSARPVRIEPSSEGTVSFCFRTDSDGTFVDTLTISNGCITRNILAIRIEAAEDRLAPTLTRSADSCNRTIVLETADNRTFDAGVDTIALQLSNLTARREFVNPNPLPNATQLYDSTKRPQRITLTVVNPRLDATYSVLVRDSVGNETRLSDTIQGYTLRLRTSTDTSISALRSLSLPATTPQTPLQQYEYRFRDVNATARACGGIILENDGVLPFVLDNNFAEKLNLGLAGNTRFSVPPAQFPLVVPPRGGGTRTLTICFNPSDRASFLDTLTINAFCFREQIILAGDGILPAQLVGTRCSATVRLSPTIRNTGVANNAAGILNGGQAQNTGKTLFAQHFPDPAFQTITLRIDAEEAQLVKVRLLSMLGVEIASLPAQALARGVWDMDMHLEAIETGTYVCEITSTVPEEPKPRRWTAMVRVIR